MKQCSIFGCTGRYEAKGYCVKHYKRFKKTGDALTPSRYDARPYRLIGADLYVPIGTGAKDGYAIISQNDLWVAYLKWHRTKGGYAATRINGRLVTMHRLVLSEPDGEIDHINRDKLDNRRSNLRLVSRSTNATNVGLRSTNTTGYKGVSYSKAARKFEAYMTRQGIRTYLGLYLTPKEAHAAYLKAAAH